MSWGFEKKEERTGESDGSGWGNFKHRPRSLGDTTDGARAMEDFARIVDEAVAKRPNNPEGGDQPVQP